MPPITKDEIPSPKGTTITLGTTNLAFRYVELTLPGFTATPINLTAIDATRYYTNLLEKMIKVGQFTFTGYYDGALTDTAMTTVIGLNQLCTIALPQNPLATLAGGSLAVWGSLASLTPNGMALANGDGIGFAGVFEVSNLNASLAETAPAYTAATITT